jgi:hypothetical protein
MLPLNSPTNFYVCAFLVYRIPKRGLSFLKEGWFDLSTYKSRFPFHLCLSALSLGQSCNHANDFVVLVSKNAYLASLQLRVELIRALELLVIKIFSNRPLAPATEKFYGAAGVLLATDYGGPKNFYELCRSCRCYIYIYNGWLHFPLFAARSRVERDDRFHGRATRLAKSANAQRRGGNTHRWQNKST